jgi:hypothetical protein
MAFKRKVKRPVTLVKKLNQVPSEALIFGEIVNVLVYRNAKLRFSFLVYNFFGGCF